MDEIASLRRRVRSDVLWWGCVLLFPLSGALTLGLAALRAHQRHSPQIHSWGPEPASGTEWLWSVVDWPVTVAGGVTAAVVLIAGGVALRLLVTERTIRRAHRGGS
ncbi:hypothetical protein GCM10027160_09510 [Streptomyces calidiresistens]|uniref:Uncharacterized protein n=1 Tax=Streptomyces calidiresistens TaxID=1485586 RepID=A0A7W3SZP5_9ACTN|nr:hypothetical protein [Streptomyces calidiresistens]MBB0228190.1 hypothetical protein [Streptomyces calidiresistens]